MYNQLLLFLEPIPVVERHLISGGAAWSDHLAVTAYLSGACQGLTIFMPCPSFGADPTYSNNWAHKFYGSPDAAIANKYHALFSSTLEIHSLYEIEQAHALGAELVPGTDFKQRNSAIAWECERLIAFTFGAKWPEDGGTLDTWNKCKDPKPKLHVNIGDERIYGTCRYVLT